MKKIIAFLLVVSLTATVAIGGTLAYFTDRDSEANVFTVGNVEIDLNEEFDQGSTLIPGVTIEKEPTITNTGINDAWVWAEIAIPSALNDTSSASKNALHFNMSAESVADGQWNWWDGADYSEGTYMIQHREIDGVKYDVYVVQYETALKPGETTANPVIYKVYLDTHVDIDPDGNWAWVENGVATSIDWNSETNGNPVIYVSAYAMQTDGFETVYEAYDAYTKQWTTEDGVNNGAEYAEAATVTEVSTAEELADALAAGGVVVLNQDISLTETVNITNPVNINLNDHELTVSVLEAKADTTISNGTLNHGKSTYPAISVSAGTLHLDNVDVVCNEYCNLMTSGSAEAAEYSGVQVWGGKLVMDDCTITVSTDKIRYSNSVFAIGIHGGEVIMNGGEITINNHGSTKDKYNYEAVIFAGRDGDKTVTMNNVKISTSEGAKYLYAWGGHTTLNTTDTVTDDQVNALNGGTYTIK